MPRILVSARGAPPPRAALALRSGENHGQVPLSLAFHALNSSWPAALTGRSVRRGAPSHAILETRFHARARLGFDLGREEIETRTSPLDLSVDLRRFREQPVARPLVGNPL